MTEGLVQVAPDSTGKKVRTQEISAGGNTVEQQVVTLAKSDGTLDPTLTVDGSGVTQPVSATSLPLPTGAATVAKQPALGTAGTASADVISVQGIASMTALKVDGSAVTQPVSAANLDVALSTRLKPADTLAGVTTVAAVTAITNALPAGTNKLGTVDVATAPATAKGTQGANGVPTQDLKDAGRTQVTLYLDTVTGTTSDTLATMNITKNAATVTAATSYQVTAGKTFRISGMHTSVKNTSTVASDSRVRLRQAASSLSNASPIIMTNEAGTPAAIANAVGTDDTVITDGLEVAGGQLVGISHIESATTCTVSVVIVGFEY